MARTRGAHRGGSSSSHAEASEQEPRHRPTASVCKRVHFRFNHTLPEVDFRFTHTPEVDFTEVDFRTRKKIIRFP
ncbi:hypothetical protein DEO72_LG7g1710 [Vigna unguiculata]|uniref:Uncharacterized protein n=1 Tax=Vigna unguiculata TaxID=3917 RepID=A0A4D6MG48_VIGUN|nr:hypothetical protein DEO72_LG7g1710 [Vigna unguiculata]